MNKSHFYNGPIFKITKEVTDRKTGKVTRRPLKDKYGNVVLYVVRAFAESNAAELQTEKRYEYETKGKKFAAYAEEWKPTKRKKVKAKRKRFAIQWGVNYLKLTRKGKRRITIDFYANPNRATLYKTKGEAQKMLDLIRWRGAKVGEVK